MLGSRVTSLDNASGGRFTWHQLCKRSILTSTFMWNSFHIILWIDPNKKNTPKVPGRPDLSCFLKAAFWLQVFFLLMKKHENREARTRDRKCVFVRVGGLGRSQKKKPAAHILLKPPDNMSIVGLRLTCSLTKLASTQRARDGVPSFSLIFTPFLLL